MSIPAETGHHENVRTFYKLIAFCTNCGPRYNPSPVRLQLTALQAVVAKAETCMENLQIAVGKADEAATRREKEFTGLKELLKLLRNAIQASDIPPLTIKEIVQQLNLIAGYSSPAEITPEEAAAQAAAGKKTVRTKRIKTSFSARLEEMRKMLTRMEVTQGYTPNEKELSLNGLQTLLATLQTVHDNAVGTKNTEEAMRMDQFKCLYSDPESMVNVAEGVKKYLKSIYPRTSPEYKQITDLKFNKYRVRK